MKENYFTIIKNNKKIECEILLAFKENNINYIIYNDNEDKYLASRYIIKDNKLHLEPIQSEKEWDLIDRKLCEVYG